LSIAAARQVVAVLDSHMDSLAYAFEAAQHALGPLNTNQPAASSSARARIEQALLVAGFRRLAQQNETSSVFPTSHDPKGNSNA
jgi:hypothetical protein